MLADISSEDQPGTLGKISLVTMPHDPFDHIDYQGLRQI